MSASDFQNGIHTNLVSHRWKHDATFSFIQQHPYFLLQLSMKIFLVNDFNTLELLCARTKFKGHILKIPTGSSRV